MIRVLWLLRRKPGISFAQFREHYETSHAVLGQKYLGHLLLGYRRNYVLPAEAATSPVLQRVLAAKGWDYDCVAEWDLADEAAFEQVVAILSDPEIGAIFHADEEHFLDRAAVRLVLADRSETDTSQCTAAVPQAMLSPATTNLWDI